MDNYWWCALLFRLVLPLVITIAGFMRPTVTSYIYLIVGCYTPFYSVPIGSTLVHSTGLFLKVLIGICGGVSLIVMITYFSVFSPSTDYYDLEPCSTLETVLRTMGVVQYRDLDIGAAITWILPEPLMLITSLVVFMGCKKLGTETAVRRASKDLREKELQDINRRKIVHIMLIVSKYFVVFLLCFIAVLRGTLLGFIYYFLFLLMLTYWACNKSFGTLFAKVLICMIPLVFLNITIMFGYQFQYFYDSKDFDPQSIWGRLLYLIEIKTYKDCKDPRIFQIHNQGGIAYTLLICLYFLYYLTVLVSREILQAKDGFIQLIVALCKREEEGDHSQKLQRVLLKIHREQEEDKAATPALRLLNKIQEVTDQILQLIMSYSYLSANFMMMIWAICSISWRTLVILIWANLIWLLPARKKVMLVTSPFLVAWLWFLLLIGYLYSLNLTSEELPSQIGIFILNSGIERGANTNWVHQFIRSLFAIVIFSAMRQLWQERAFRKQQSEIERITGLTDIEELKRLNESEQKNKLLKSIQSFSSRIFVLGWIWIVIFAMVWLEFWTTSNMFRIVFVGLAVVFIMSFQLCPFKYWKQFLWIYWWIVIVYAMINLFAVYMYQSSEIRNAFFEFFPEELFERYGFYFWTDRKERFFNLASPIFFQIAVVVQQNFLQTEFNRLTSPLTLDESDEQESQEKATKWAKAKTKITNAINILFAVLEVHMHNIIRLVGWFMCVFDTCALFVPLMLMLCVSCVFGRAFTTIIIYVISCVVQVLIVLRLVYMNRSTEHSSWNYVGHYERNGQPFNKTLNAADWLGFHESSYGSSYADFGQLSWCFFYVFVVTVMRVVSIRMRNYRLRRNLSITRRSVLFPDVTFENCHESVASMFKFLVNYGFYKFGCEISIVFAAVMMGLRMDAVAIALSIWLLIAFSLNRAWLRILFAITLVLWSIAVPLQYLATLGYWPVYWEKSMTRFWSSSDLLVRIQQFCHLPNMAHPPIKQKISLDFLFLFMVSRQWRAFRVEWKYKGQYFPAGNNDNVASLLDNPDTINPVPDFVTYTRSHLDIFKRIFFNGWFYMSLITTFLAGTERVTWYSFGYILCAFVFVWEGTNLFLRPPKAIMRRWNFLMGYTILVMVTRCSTQIFGCILKYEKDVHFNCRVFQTFGVGCVDKFHMTEGIPNLSRYSTCKVSYGALGLGYDCFCFFFLVFQQRIFKSFHFFHMVNEIKASLILADRGANLIEEKRSKRRQALDADDALIRDNIKKKMDKMRAVHQKVQGEVYERRKKNNKQMLKSGDYYLFEEAILSSDIPLLLTKLEEDEDEIDPYDPPPLSEYFRLWHDTNIPTVLADRALRRQQKNSIQEGKKPEKLKGALITKNAKPGTSKDPAPLVTDLSKLRKIINILLFIWGGFESTIVSITGLINRATRDIRSILHEMNRETRILKENSTYTEGVRLGSNKIWQPSVSYKNLLKTAKPKAEVVFIEYSIYVKLVRAIGYLLLSWSEWICYWTIIMNQVLAANFLSLPLVVLMFCWGALTVPRPTKTFWIIAIAYVLIMLFTQMFFVMDIIPWNNIMETHQWNLFFPPVIIGVNDYGVNNVTLDISILVTLFFHRIVLQMLGLWKPFAYRIESLLPDGDYLFKSGKLVALPPDNAVKDPQTLKVESVSIPIGDYFPESVLYSFAKYAEGFKMYIQQLVFPSATQIPVDVYTLIFLCDLVNITLIIFFFGSFSAEGHDQGFISFIGDNRVPLSFIMVVLVYFLLILVDRAIYLRKNRFAKLVYFFFQIIIWHIWCFVLHPILTQRYFENTPVVQTFYAFKCLYFLFSAYQIKNGYPSLISRHFLWHGTSMFHRFGYKFFRMIPYFFELRTLLDWIFSDSCLGLGPWFLMEEITQNIFDQKCEQEFEEKWNSPGGQAKNRNFKYFFGGFLYVLLILTVIFPFVLFSLGSAVGVKTHPPKFKIELYMGSAEPIFQSYASKKNLKSFNQSDYVNLTGTFNNIEHSADIFNNFQPEDVVAVRWFPDSLTRWRVSPGTFMEIMRKLKSNDSFEFRLEIHYTHIGHGGQKDQKKFGQTVYIPPLPNVNREELIKMLEAKQTIQAAVWLPMMFPKFLMITKESKPRALPLMEDPLSVYKGIVEKRPEEATQDDDDDDLPSEPKIFRNLLVTLQHSDDGQMWWHLQEECSLDDDNYLYYLKDLVFNSCERLTIYTFNEKVFSSAMRYITQSGILGLYLLYFMLIIGIIRGCRIDVDEIWIEDLPNSDYMMRKCFEVYVARDMQNYELEEHLYAELIFVMRSRELLIKLTRPDITKYNPAIVAPGSKKTQ